MSLPSTSSRSSGLLRDCKIFADILQFLHRNNFHNLSHCWVTFEFLWSWLVMSAKLSFCIHNANSHRMELINNQVQCGYIPPFTIPQFHSPLPRQWQWKVGCCFTQKAWHGGGQEAGSRVLGWRMCVLRSDGESFCVRITTQFGSVFNCGIKFLRVLRHGH